MSQRGSRDRSLRVINIGLPVFAVDLDEAGLPVVHVDWQPPAGGDERLVALLVRLEEGSAHDDRDAQAQTAKDHA
jgi:FdrA protein